MVGPQVQHSSLTAQQPANVDKEHRIDHTEDENGGFEKWHLLQESGLFRKIQISAEKGKAAASNATTTMKNKKHPHSHEGITDAERYFVIEGIVFSIPTTCLFVVMDILVHRQSGQDYSTELITQKMLKAFPAVLVMVYFSNKNKANKLVQTGMFLTATVCGCYFLHTMFKSPALAIMKRAPGVITILVYCIIQLNLVSAIASLAICGLYYIFENATFRH